MSAIFRHVQVGRIFTVAGRGSMAGGAGAVGVIRWDDAQVRLDDRRDADRGLFWAGAVDAPADAATAGESTGAAAVCGRGVHAAAGFV